MGLFTRSFLCLFGAIVAALPASQAVAQAWPSRTVTLVVPFAPGVSSDAMARGFAEFLGKQIGQTVVVENKGGAGGNIGAAAVARSAPDGYTFLFATTGQAATNILMYKEMAYNPTTDFTPVILLGKLPVIVATRKDGPFNSFKAMIDYAKANPGKLNAAFPGNGTLGHITGLLLAREAGITLAEVQYKGTGEIIKDLLGGHVDVAMDSAAGYLSNVEKGNLTALAMASSKRFGPLPAVPTLAESGFSGFEASVWYALLAPAGVPPEVVARVNAAANAYLASDAGKAFYTRLGVEIAGGTPGDLKAFIAAEQAKWGPVIKGAKIEF